MTIGHGLSARYMTGLGIVGNCSLAGARRGRSESVIGTSRGSCFLSRCAGLACRVARTANFCYLSPMILRPGQMIAGRPAKDIRKLLREIHHLQVSSAYIRDVLGCSMDAAKQVLSALEREGYLSRAGRHEGHDLYETTLKGNQLAGANLRPISRATAERTLRAFMQRVGAANSNPDYLETITGVIVFGSFLSPSDELGDQGRRVRPPRSRSLSPLSMGFHIPLAMMPCANASCLRARRFGLLP